MKALPVAAGTCMMCLLSLHSVSTVVGQDCPGLISHNDPIQTSRPPLPAYLEPYTEQAYGSYLRKELPASRMDLSKFREHSP